MKVLLIGVDPNNAEMVVLSLRLRWPDTRPLVATQAREGVDLVERELPDVIIVQPSFTDMSLSQVIVEIRGFSEIPLVVLGEDGGQQEAIKALELGADDYIRSPYGFVELVARVVALLRRVPGREPGGVEAPILSGSLVVNPATYEVFLGERRITLTSTEFRLLYLLVNNRGMVVPHRLLERTLWGERVDSSSLAKKYIQRLRQKLGDDCRKPQWIANVHGVGYRFVGPSRKAAEEAKPLVHNRSY
jgi:DNA-binding response OmpR family regulator